MAKKKTPAKGVTQRSPLRTFRRTLERHKHNPRAGLAEAITECSASSIPIIVAELLKDQAYRNIVAASAFPDQIKRPPSITFIAIKSPEKIFLWNAAVIACYAERIAKFVVAREQYNRFLFLGNLEQCEEALSEIARSFGQSLWLIKNKLLVLQLRYGFVAQKEYLKDLLQSQDGNQVFAYIAFYKSLSCEQNVSLETVEEEVASVLATEQYGDYIKYHLLPYLGPSIKEPWRVVAMEEVHPMIDRFEALVEMAFLELARGNDIVDGYVSNALLLLAPTNDERIADMLEYLHAASPADWFKRIEPVFDRYIEGQLFSDFLLNERTLEVEAALATWLTSYPSRDGLADSVRSVVDAMGDVMLLSVKSHTAEQYLRKYAWIHSPHPVTTHLAAFLERRHRLPVAERPTELDLLSAFKFGFVNPWAITVLANHRDGRAGLEKLLELGASSSALTLALSLCQDYPIGYQLLDELPIPEQRRCTYKGHLALLRHDNTAAVQYYQMALNLNDPKYVIRRVTPHLYLALFSLGQFRACIDLVLANCLGSERNISLFPIEQLVGEIGTNDRESKTIEFVILVYLASRVAKSHSSVSISDMVENFLLGERVSRPSELLQIQDRYNPEYLKYFFRNVCSLKVLDGLTEFRDVDDLDAERMLICRMLIEIDSENTEDYLEEIRSITRDAENAELLRLVQSSMIYVDEEGLLLDIGSTLQESHNRFLEFKKLPEMKAGSAGFAEQLEGIFKKEAPIGEPAASELEGLFARILHHFAMQFALHPAYGLDIHLATTIRHHTFEGHFRRPFDKEHLLCFKVTKDGEYELPQIWSRRLSDISIHELKIVESALSKFTEKIVAEIDRYVDHLLEIRQEGTHTEGLIDLFVDRTERLALLDEAVRSEDYAHFVAILMDCCWRMVDQSLIAIRRELETVTLPYVNRELAALEARLSNMAETPQTELLLDAIVSAQTLFQNSIIEIGGWFHRPQELARGPFEFANAIDVAYAQVCNCWGGVGLQLVRQVNVPFEIRGEYLDGIVEVLFILIQNIFRHSGQRQPDLKGVITVSASGDDIVINVQNPLGNAIDAIERSNSAKLAVEHYKADHVEKLTLARKNSGSGLSKVWRILEFSLHKESTLSLEVTASHEFVTNLTIIGTREAT